MESIVRMEGVSLEIFVNYYPEEKLEVSYLN